MLVKPPMKRVPADAPGCHATGSRVADDAAGRSSPRCSPPRRSARSAPSPAGSSPRPPGAPSAGCSSGHGCHSLLGATTGHTASSRMPAGRQHKSPRSVPCPLVVRLLVADDAPVSSRSTTRCFTAAGRRCTQRRGSTTAPRSVQDQGRLWQQLGDPGDRRPARVPSTGPSRCRSGFALLVFRKQSDDSSRLALARRLVEARSLTRSATGGLHVVADSAYAGKALTWPADVADLDHAVALQRLALRAAAPPSGRRGRPLEGRRSSRASPRSPPAPSSLPTTVNRYGMAADRLGRRAAPAFGMACSAHNRFRSSSSGRSRKSGYDVALVTTDLKTPPPPRSSNGTPCLLVAPRSLSKTRQTVVPDRRATAPPARSSATVPFQLA